LGTLWLAMSDFLDPGRGPEQSGDFEISPGFFFVLLGFGFLLGVVGHVTKVRFLVAAGVILIFLATVALPIALQATN
jgi:hypothetical protein